LLFKQDNIENGHSPRSETHSRQVRYSIRLPLLFKAKDLKCDWKVLEGIKHQV